jgi:hypothetical protein
MADYRLTFPDEATWMAQADAAGWVQYEYEPQPPTPPGENPPAPVVKRSWVYTSEAGIVQIGTIYERQAPVPIDQPQPTPVPFPGYGINVRMFVGSLPENMVPYIVYPADPQYTFAGGWDTANPQPQPEP